MSGLHNLNLIHFFDFYLMFMFLAGTLRRIGQYHAVVALVVTGPGRWPKLLQLVKEHRTIFLTWTTVLPGALALGLSLTQLLASRLVWPHSHLTLGGLADHGWAVPFITVLGAAMLGVDLYGILVVGTFDRAQMEKLLDQAEYWLRSKTAHVVRFVTFGVINPRQMVAVEVRKALIDASQLLNTTLWWVAVQCGLRVAFGLALWLTWALT
jgi:hypothetical protein